MDDYESWLIYGFGDGPDSQNGDGRGNGINDGGHNGDSWDDDLNDDWNGNGFSLSIEGFRQQ